MVAGASGGNVAIASNGCMDYICQSIYMLLLREKGFRLGRPEVDTLEGSRHANMKELRVKVLEAQWRCAFALDPERKAVVLCGGAKSGVSQKLFYKRLIDLADKRYDEHLSGLEKKHG